MSDEIKKKQEEKMQFKVNDCDWHVVDTIAFLDLYNDDRLTKLMSHLNSVHEEIKRLKETNFAAAPKPKQMNSDTRQKIYDWLLQTKKDHMFGDGQEKDMIRWGATFIGLDDMDDEQLLQEFAEIAYFDDDDDEENKLYNTAVAEMELNHAIDS